MREWKLELRWWDTKAGSKSLSSVTNTDLSVHDWTLGPPDIPLMTSFTSFLNGLKQYQIYNQAKKKKSIENVSTQSKSTHWHTATHLKKVLNMLESPWPCPTPFSEEVGWVELPEGDSELEVSPEPEVTELGELMDISLALRWETWYQDHRDWDVDVDMGDKQ